MADRDMSRPIINPYKYEPFPKCVYKAPQRLEVRDARLRDQAIAQGYVPTSEDPLSFPQVLERSVSKVVADADALKVAQAEGWHLSVAEALAPKVDEAPKGRKVKADAEAAA